jgi:hypothetical protein
MKFSSVALGALALSAAAPAGLSRPSDLKVVTRHSTFGHTSTSVTYIKGERARLERTVERANTDATKTAVPVVIYQCDLRRVLTLDPANREYTSYDVNNEALPSGSVRVLPHCQEAPRKYGSKRLTPVNAATSLASAPATW